MSTPPNTWKGQHPCLASLFHYKDVTKKWKLSCAHDVRFVLVYILYVRFNLIIYINIVLDTICVKSLIFIKHRNIINLLKKILSNWYKRSFERISKTESRELKPTMDNIISISEEKNPLSFRIIRYHYQYRYILII